MSELTRGEREKKLREGYILDAALSVFSEHGYDGASMDVIAKKAQFTKKTVYKYFPNKVDLYFAVVLQEFKNMSKAPIPDGKTAFEKIYNNSLRQYQRSKENPKLYKVLSEIGYVRRKDAISPHRDAWYKFDDIMFNEFSKLFEKGIKDGSIRSDIDPTMASFACGFLTSGLFKMLNEGGENFADHFDLDLEKFSIYTIELLLYSFKA